MNRQELRQVLDCGCILCILPLSFGPRAFPKRQNTAAVHDAVALNATHGGSWSQWRKKYVEAFHESSRTPPGFGLRLYSLSSALSFWTSHVSQAAVYSRSPRRCRAVRHPPIFMVPIAHKILRGFP